MKNASFIFEYEPWCRLPKADIVAASMMLKPEIQRIEKAVHQHYVTPYAALYAPYDDAQHASVLSVVHEKRKLGCTLVIVIGIGGSNLGAQAIFQALYGTLYNDLNPQHILYWVDTVATDYIHDLMRLMDNTLQNGNKVLLVMISKSGTTIETQANAACFIARLKTHNPDHYRDYIVVITDAQSPLWHCAHDNRFSCLEIPALVGGRYSVMSAAGLFPLAYAGIDVQALCAGARDMLDEALTMNVLSRPAISATILALQYKQGKRVHDFFIFDPAFELLGKWYRQLLSESIGKEHDMYGRRVNVGFTATVSIGSTDLHSVVQRYVAGPNDSITSFLAVAPTHTWYVADAHDGCAEQQLVGQSLSTIMHVLLRSVQKVYAHTERAYVHYAMPRKDAYMLGYYMQWKMLETIYVGFLLGVNPFDQPAVELYKRETRELLNNE
jgi:glucose-6-phosphate isomerase